MADADVDERGWSAEELARMNIRDDGTLTGCLSETDGRNFMSLLDMCHFLVDRITQRHNFADVNAASALRATSTEQSAMLTAEMYSYWDAAPAGPGVYELLLHWLASQPGVGAAGLMARETGRSRAPNPMAALHALAVNECKQWPRRRKTGVFYFAGEDASGAALLADDKLKSVYRVLGIATSLGDMLRAGGRAGSGGTEQLIGSSLLLTLLPFMGFIVCVPSHSNRGTPEREGGREPAAIPVGARPRRLLSLRARLVCMRLISCGWLGSPQV